MQSIFFDDHLLQPAELESLRHIYTNRLEAAHEELPEDIEDVDVEMLSGVRSPIC